MNENLNLVDILKDCPQGYKLYSPIYGEVKFEKIINDKNYPILFNYRDMACEFYVGNVTKDGRHNVKYEGECVLFPSKEQHDWSKFKVQPEMIDGEFYYCNYKGRKYVFIYKKKDDLYKTNNYAIIKINDLPYLLKQDAPIYCGNVGYFDELRNATEEEKRMLFQIIEKNGRKWDADKKKLVEIEPKFDISTLQPFDKVLVRDFDNDIWTCSFHELFLKYITHPFITTRGSYKQCIPYNDETKHLVRKTEMPPEKYINWGDNYEKGN